MTDPSLLTLQKQLPFLPGHQFDLSKVRGCADLQRQVKLTATTQLQYRPNERKSHAFDYCNGVPVFKSDAPGIGASPLDGQNENRVRTSLDIYPHNQNLGESVPAWVAFDRKVRLFPKYLVVSNISEFRSFASMPTSKRPFMKSARRSTESEGN
jgi:hypothetical protein